MDCDAQPWALSSFSAHTIDGSLERRPGTEVGQPQSILSSSTEQFLSDARSFQLQRLTGPPSSSYMPVSVQYRYEDAYSLMHKVWCVAMVAIGIQCRRQIQQVTNIHAL